MRTREEYLKAKREGMARQRAKDPEGARQRRMAWHHRNRERQTKKMRDYTARRFFWNREMHLRQSGRATARELAGLWRRQRGRCALTGRRLDRANAHLDHIVPLARGGGDGVGNLRWLCHEANLAKRALSDAQFVALCGAVMRWIGLRIAEVERE